MTKCISEILVWKIEIRGSTAVLANIFIANIFSTNCLLLISITTACTVTSHDGAVTTSPAVNLYTWHVARKGESETCALYKINISTFTSLIPQGDAATDDWLTVTDKIESTWNLQIYHWQWKTTHTVLSL